MVKKKELITITKEEYDILKIEENVTREVMRFLAENHHDIYMNICNSRLDRIERMMNGKKVTKRWIFSKSD